MKKRHPNVEITLGPDGEVLVRGADLFAGYWRDEAATAASYRDGWLVTGDVGEWRAPGGLRLVDRKKDVLITAGGPPRAPSWSRRARELPALWASAGVARRVRDLSTASDDRCVAVLRERRRRTLYVRLRDPGRY